MANKSQKSVSDNLFDVDDIPVPHIPEGNGVIEDDFTGPSAYKFAFVGLGQGGGRIAEQMWQLGYRRVCAVNTAAQDLDPLKDLPSTHKLDLGTGGAGKDRSAANKAITGREEDVFDLLKKTWGDQVDYAFVCCTAGGGTGSGTWPIVVSVIKKFFEYRKLPQRVGAIVCLPKNEEGSRPAKNAIACFSELRDAHLSPLVLIDNERIKTLYPRAPVARTWTITNQGTCSLLHLFNKMAGSDSEYKPLDKADFATLLDSGLVVFGSTIIEPCTNETDIAAAIRDHLKKNVLADVDLSKGRVAGAVFVGGASVFDKLAIEFLDYGVAALSRLLSPGAVVHGAIYPGTKDDLRCFSMVGGLDFPESRLQELAKIAGT